MGKQIIIERLINARERLGINKAEAARRLNLSRIGYNRYESGERTPSPQMMEIIAQCFNTSVDYLTGKTTNISSNSIVIRKDDEPDLYELVNELTSDQMLLRRMLAYYKKLNIK